VTVPCGGLLLPGVLGLWMHLQKGCLFYEPGFWCYDYKGLGGFLVPVLVTVMLWTLIFLPRGGVNPLGYLCMSVVCFSQLASVPCPKAPVDFAFALSWQVVSWKCEDVGSTFRLSALYHNLSSRCSPWHGPRAMFPTPSSAPKPYLFMFSVFCLWHLDISGTFF
jgi:hypothetical protein